MNESAPFDVDGLIADLDQLWITYAKIYQKKPDEGIRCVMNFVETVEQTVKKNRHEKSWKQGTLFDELERIEKERS